MAYRTRINPLGAPRQVGRRGALRQTTFVRLEKSDALLTVESALEVLLAKLLDLSNDVIEIQYQPFTIDIAHERLLLTHEALQEHRTELKRAGLKGLFYTPDLRVIWKAAAGTAIEVIEAKDSQWVPNHRDEYAHKQRCTQQLLESVGARFGLYEANVRNLYRSAFASNIYKLHATKLRRQDAMGTVSPDFLAYLHHREHWISHLLNQGESTILQLAESVGTTAWAVWHLLIDEIASCDLTTAALNPSTIIQAISPPGRSNAATVTPFRAALLGMRNRTWEQAHA
ncbi:Tn7 transposase TnsA N-terminal domain-containing protein [Castellaniella sp.]|uniref:Tn7 transposase TnsA N-terminal domain-containing protein n=1 Tax=Castellaniella sp. TaxID=1955812 RepID=UPI003A8F595E